MPRNVVATSSEYLVLGSGIGDNLGNALSFSCWFRSTLSDISYAHLFDKGGGDWRAGRSVPNNRIGLFIRCTSGSASAESDDNAVVQNQWQHYFQWWDPSYDSGNPYVYIDGVEVTYAARTPNTNPRASDSSHPWTFGARADPSGYFTGDMAHYALWTANIISPSGGRPYEHLIKALASGVSPLRIRPDVLWGYWPLDGATSDTAGERNLANPNAINKDATVGGGSPNIVADGPGPWGQYWWNVPIAFVVDLSQTIAMEEVTLASSAQSLTVVPGGVTIAMGTATLASSAQALDVAPTTTIVMEEVSLASSAQALDVVPGTATVSMSAVTLASSPQALTVGTALVVSMSEVTLAASPQAMNQASSGPWPPLDLDNRFAGLGSAWNMGPYYVSSEDAFYVAGTNYYSTQPYRGNFLNIWKCDATSDPTVNSNWTLPAEWSMNLQYDIYNLCMVLDGTDLHIIHQTYDSAGDILRLYYWQFDTSTDSWTIKQELIDENSQIISPAQDSMGFVVRADGSIILGYGKFVSGTTETHYLKRSSGGTWASSSVQVDVSYAAASVRVAPGSGGRTHIFYGNVTQRTLTSADVLQNEIHYSPRSLLGAYSWAYSYTYGGNTYLGVFVQDTSQNDYEWGFISADNPTFSEEVLNNVISMEGIGNAPFFTNELTAVPVKYVLRRSPIDQDGYIYFRRATDNANWTLNVPPGGEWLDADTLTNPIGVGVYERNNTGVNGIFIEGTSTSTTVVLWDLDAPLYMDAVTLTASPQSLTVVAGAVTVPLSAVTLASSAQALTVVQAQTVSLSAVTLASSAQALDVIPGAATAVLEEVTLAGSAQALDVKIAQTVVMQEVSLVSSTQTLIASVPSIWKENNVAFQGTTSSSAISSGSLTLTNANVLFVGIANRDDRTISSVKWDAAGVDESLTSIYSRAIGSSYRSALYALRNPTQKTATVTVTFSGDCNAVCGAIGFYSEDDITQVIYDSDTADDATVSVDSTSETLSLGHHVGDTITIPPFYGTIFYNSAASGGGYEVTAGGGSWIIGNGSSHTMGFLQPTTTNDYNFAVTLAPGIVVQMGAVTLASSLPVMEDVVVDQTIALEEISLVSSAQALNVIVDQTVSLSAATLASSAQALDVVAGAATVSMQEATLVSSAQALDVVPGTATVSLSEATLVSSAQALDVIPGSVTASMSAVTLTSSAQALAVSVGAVTVSMQEATLVSSAQALDVIPGAVTIVMQEATLVSSAQAFTLIATGADQTIALQAITLSASPQAAVILVAIIINMQEITLAGSPQALSASTTAAVLPDYRPIARGVLRGVGRGF